MYSVFVPKLGVTLPFALHCVSYSFLSFYHIPYIYCRVKTHAASKNPRINRGFLRTLFSTWSLVLPSRMLAFALLWPPILVDEIRLVLSTRETHAALNSQWNNRRCLYAPYLRLRSCKSYCSHFLLKLLHPGMVMRVWNARSIEQIICKSNAVACSFTSHLPPPRHHILRLSWLVLRFGMVLVWR